MLKEIPISELRVGMFLHDIDLNLSLFPAIKKGVKISSNNILQNIIDCGVKKVVIDTDKGLTAVEQPEVASVKHKIEITRLKKPNRRVISADPLPEVEPRSFDEEIQTAQPLRKKIMQSISDAFYDARLGRALDTPQLRQSVKDMTLSVLRNQDAFLALNQIRHKASYLYDHAINCCVFVVCLAKWKKLDYETVIDLGMAALLHDIGETRLDDRLLRNKGFLNEKEYVEIQQHVRHSVEILSSLIGISPRVVKMVQEHHERLDGSGYPMGLSGKQIDIFSQMIGLVDVYDSMTAETTYSYAMAPTHVLKQLLESGDDLFDKQLIQQFIKSIGIYPVGSLVRLTNGCIAIVKQISNQDSLNPVVQMIYNARQEHYIQPVEINLADPTNNSPQLSITGCVDPNQLHINMASFI